MSSPQIGDKVGMTGYLEYKLRGVDLYYIGDTYNNEAMVMSLNGNFQSVRITDITVRLAECYDKAAKCRMKYERQKNLSGDRLKPLVMPSVVVDCS